MVTTARTRLEMVLKRNVRLVNYSGLPHSGLPGPRLLRSELPVSASELIPEDTAVPDSAGDFPLRAGRGVPLLPTRHSATRPMHACVCVRSYIGRILTEHLTPPDVHRGRKPAEFVDSDDDGECIPSLSLTSLASEGGALPACNSVKEGEERKLKREQDKNRCDRTGDSRPDDFPRISSSFS